MLGSYALRYALYLACDVRDYMLESRHTTQATARAAMRY
jgi:hypothetical protein